MKTLWKTVACSWGYLALALACLIQWNGSDPWIRVAGCRVVFRVQICGIVALHRFQPWRFPVKAGAE